MRVQYLIYFAIVVLLGCITIKPDKTIPTVRNNGDISISTITGSNLALESNQKYTFNLFNLNDAYYGVDYNIIKTKKTISLGSVLSPYIPQSSTAVRQAAFNNNIAAIKTQNITSFLPLLHND